MLASRLGLVFVRILVVTGLSQMALFCSAAEPLPQAHAHNDYLHARPLLDALEHGFCSVEADVFAIDGELRVAHNLRDTEPGRTLESLYLEPMRKIAKNKDGYVLSGRTQLTLLVDFKSAGDETYALLKEKLKKYRDLLEPVGQVANAPVQVVVSGNRPVEMILADKDRLCGIDGRLSDLESRLSASEMPLISDNWRKHFQWRGERDFPAAEKEKLHGIVAQCHRRGRRIRFWATPESEAIWLILVEAGVDHLNTDQLSKLEAFLKARESGRP